MQHLWTAFLTRLRTDEGYTSDAVVFMALMVAAAVAAVGILAPAIQERAGDIADMLSGG